jgi:MFS family permease
MKLTAISFAIFLCYFTFSVFVNSTFVVIEQSLYEYGEDSDSAAILQKLQNIAYLFVAIVVAPFLRTFGYKKILLGITSIATLAVLCMPFGTNLLVPKIFYFFSGLGFGLSRLIGYEVLYDTAPNEKYFSGIINFFEGLFLLGALFSVLIFGGAMHFEFLQWRKMFLLLGILGIGSIFLLYRTEMEILHTSKDIIQVRKIKEIIKTFKGSFSILRYTLVWLFLLILLFVVLNETQFMKWLPLFCVEVVKMPKGMMPQIFVPILFAGFLGRLVASIILMNTNVLVVIVSCLFGVMTILFTITHISQTEVFMVVKEWEKMPPIVWFLPLLSFFWSPILPTLFVTVLNNTSTTKYASKTSMLGLLLVFLFIFQLFTQPITKYIFSIFSVSVAFFVSIIFVMILLTMIILLINDLRKTA